MSHFHWGLIGLKIGDTITFKPNGQKFLIASGDGSPKNGGDLVFNEQITGNRLFSIRYATRRMLGADFNNNIDILKFWEYEGKTLRECIMISKLTNLRNQSMVSKDI